jgi:hypothetical protein
MAAGHANLIHNNTTIGAILSFADLCTHFSDDNEGRTGSGIGAVVIVPLCERRAGRYFCQTDRIHSYYGCQLAARPGIAQSSQPRPRTVNMKSQNHES